MVRKDQIDTTRMNVEGFAQQLDRHRRALEVPAGTAATPRRVPRRTDLFVLRLRRLPQGEIAGVFLRVVILGDTRPGDDLTAVELRQSSVAREAIDREVDRAVIGAVGHAVVDE